VNRPSRTTELLFLACAFCVTFEKVHWAIAGTVSLEDVLVIGFLAAFAGSRLASGDRRVQQTAAAVLVFLAAFLVVYLVGFFNLETKQALAQFGKGMVKFVLHFLFLAAGVAYLARRSQRFYWRTLGVFTAGLTANAGYGVLQLLAARGGYNLDRLVLGPLTGGASSINIYGAVNGASVFRPNALTGDPNHLGIMLLVPLLALAPVYLRLEPRSRWRLPLVALLGFLLVMELATLSRSGLLGLGTGVLVLALPYRRLLLSRATLVPLGAIGLLLAFVVSRRAHFFETVLRSRFQTGGSSTSAHLGVYDFVPQILRSHPLFGLGLNNFSVYYEFVTGKTNWGPHSFYVALVVETGLVGTFLFALFLRWVFMRLRAGRQVGRALAAAGAREARYVRPLAWGLTAALVGTMASNAFYLTMQFYYFYFFVQLALALPIVFGRATSRSASRGRKTPARTIGGVT
jgi:O-antigen ligase